MYLPTPGVTFTLPLTSQPLSGVGGRSVSKENEIANNFSRAFGARSLKCADHLGWMLKFGLDPGWAGPE